MRQTIVEDRSRTILTENIVDDVDYRWTANPYRGCEHACAACYARGSHEYLDLDPGDAFDRTIVVKRAAPELLRAAFEARAWTGATVTFSSVTDPYQPIEAELEVTRRCLEVCLAYRNPVRIATRSTLVLRDIDLLQRLHADARVEVVLSIAFADAARSALLEPGAPSPADRFAAMRTLADAAVPVGLMAAPIICGLNDADLVPLLERAAASGARSACWALLRLPEPTATVFAQRLTARLPLLAPKVLKLARDSRSADEPRDKPFHTRGPGGGGYVAAIEAAFVATTTRLGLARRAFVKSVEPPTTFRRPGEQLALF